MVGRGEAPPLSVECITEGVEGDYAVLNDEARLKVLPLSKIKAAKHLHAQGQKNMEATLRQLHAMGEGASLHEALHAKHADLLKYLLYPLHDALSVCTKAHLERWTCISPNHKDIELLQVPRFLDAEEGGRGSP